AAASLSYHDPGSTLTATLSLHDALPIYQGIRSHASPAQRTGSPLVPAARHQGRGAPCGESFWHWPLGADGGHGHAQPPFRSSRLDRKSTRLNSSHVSISYAVFCLKK